MRFLYLSTYLPRSNLAVFLHISRLHFSVLESFQLWRMASWGLSSCFQLWYHIVLCITSLHISPKTVQPCYHFNKYSVTPYLIPYTSKSQDDTRYINSHYSWRLGHTDHTDQIWGSWSGEEQFPSFLVHMLVDVSAFHPSINSSEI